MMIKSHGGSFIPDMGQMTASMDLAGVDPSHNAIGNLVKFIEGKGKDERIANIIKERNDQRNKVKSHSPKSKLTSTELDDQEALR